MKYAYLTEKYEEKSLIECSDILFHFNLLSHTYRTHKIAQLMF